MLTTDSWFMEVSDKLKMKCLQELAHVKYIPNLNLKSTEEVQQDFKKIKEQIKNNEDLDSYYYNIVEEINDFNEWCISENNVWGIPVPFFIYKDTKKVLMDDEIIEHVAEVF
jgi:isoleucyl-tRNA synthetase